ncbi:MAG: SixA phosphatase family protein [Bellilinea sp.]
MKNLLLMRHAKSSFKEGEMPDFERPLSKRGEKDAPRMGKLLKDKNLVPDLILSSTAARASRTAELVAEKCGYKGEILYTQSLYLGEPEAYLEALRDLKEEDGGLQTVLVIGHNPGLESLLQTLTDHLDCLPTSAIAHLKVPLRSWGALTPQVIAQLENLWRPRDLK